MSICKQMCIWFPHPTLPPSPFSRLHKCVCLFVCWSVRACPLRDWSSPLGTPGGGSGDRIHCRCRPSFWDNVIMGRDSWQLHFLSAQISYDINNECHGPAMSTTAQRVHDCFLMCPLMSLPSLFHLLLSFFQPPQLISIPSPLLFIFTFSSLIHRSYGEYQSFPPTQMRLSLFLFIFSVAFTCLMKHEARTQIQLWYTIVSSGLGYIF